MGSSCPLYQPTEAVLPVLLYFHGGGFTVGSIRSHDITGQLACLSGCAVVSLDYRGRRTSFPDVEDVWWRSSGWRGDPTCSAWMASASRWGGDSAGGILIRRDPPRTRDAGFAVVARLLFYPGCAGRPLHPRLRDMDGRHGAGTTRIECTSTSTMRCATMALCAARTVDVSGVAPPGWARRRYDPSSTTRSPTRMNCAPAWRSGVRTPA